MFIIHLVNPAQCHNICTQREVKSAKSSQSTHYGSVYTQVDMWWWSFRSEFQDLSWSTPLYSSIQLSDVLKNSFASLIFHQINQHNFTCLGEKQRKLASHGKTTNKIREIYLLHTHFAICDLFSAEHGLVSMPPTDGSLMSRHLTPHQDGVQSLKSNGIGDTWDLQTTWLVCVLLRRT